MSSSTRVVDLVFILYLFHLQFVNCADPTDTSRLRAQILTNYDPRSRPIQNHQEAIAIQVEFLYNGFHFDELKGVLTLDVWTALGWQDLHMQWDSLVYGNLTYLHFSPEELWLPDISCINNYDEGQYDHFGKVDLVGYNDGEVWWIPPSQFQVACEADFRLWPYDNHLCAVHIASWSHLGEEINMTLYQNITYVQKTNIGFEEDWQHIQVDNREWRLKSNYVERHEYSMYCCPAVTFIQLSITVNIERKSSSHTAAVTVVGLGMASAILISFWLDPFANERLPVTLLLLLLNSVYLQYMHQVIPNNGTSVPLTISFFRDSLIMVGFAFAWTVGIRYIAKMKRNSPLPLPDFVQTILNSAAATVLCVNPRPLTKGQSQRKEADNDGDDADASELVQEDDRDSQEDWEWLARFLDRIAFVAYLITYTVFICAFL